MSNKIKNIAIIAHVDHGKTTLVDALLKQSGTFGEHEKVDERVMDSDDLEKERGITIFSKNASIHYDGYKINVVDTPGHADFGGEVQRILKMVDSVLLLVDAFEGVMPQTKYVLKQALEHGLRPIVVVNKIDRPNSDPDAVVDSVFDLFVELGANDAQLDFPVVYASAKNGFAKLELEDEDKDMQPLFEMILKHVEDPEGDENEPLQMLITNTEYDEYVGKLGTGRIYNGKVEKNQEIEEIKKDMPETRLAKVERFKNAYSIDEKDALILTEEMELSDYFEEVVKVSNNPKLSSNWILTEVLRVLKHQNIDIEKFTISSGNLAKIITLIDKNIISSKIAKELFEIALTDNRDPEIIVKEKGMVQVSDSSEIEKMVEEVLANNQKMIEDYKAADEGRKPRVLKGIVGQVMKLSKGKANPEIVNELIMSKLN